MSSTVAKNAAIDLYILTFNCGRALINVDAFSSQLFDGLSRSKLPDVLVLALQEIAPVPQSFIGGSFLTPYIISFVNAVKIAAAKHSAARNEPSPYSLVAARNMGMTAIMAFAKDISHVRDLETAYVGVGTADMGNKGAVGLRFTYDAGRSASTELTFVAAHLAAMEDEVVRRNEDWKNIVKGMVFSSDAKGNLRGTLPSASEERPLLSISPRDASIYKPTSHLFVAGDLNYRTSCIKPAPSDYLEHFPQPQVEQSSPRHFTNLLQHDQLSQERAAGRTLHGLKEAPITFPPSYKYEPTEPFLTPDAELSKWHWASHRWPSWCDRVLYLDMPSWVKSEAPQAAITPHRYTALPLQPTTDHRAVTMEFTVPLIPLTKPAVETEESRLDPRILPPFDIDIDWKKKQDNARMFELITGFTSYFTNTKEGLSIILASVIGVVGSYWAIKTLFV